MLVKTERNIKDEIQNVINSIEPVKGCMVYKTDNHIAVYLFCNEVLYKQIKQDIDKALIPYRKQFSVYTMTEDFYNSYYGRK